MRFYAKTALHIFSEYRKFELLTSLYLCHDSFHEKGSEGSKGTKGSNVSRMSQQALAISSHSGNVIKLSEICEVILCRKGSEDSKGSKGSKRLRTR